jgi:hypothetical protein
MEYTELINRILAAEQSAQDIARQVKEREQSLEADLADEAAALKQDYMEKAKAKVADIEQETAVQTKASVAALDARQAEAMAKMERAYSHYGDNWVNTLFHRIVGDKL